MLNVAFHSPDHSLVLGDNVGLIISDETQFCSLIIRPITKPVLFFYYAVLFSLDSDMQGNITTNKWPNLPFPPGRGIVRVTFHVGLVIQNRNV